jgi:hypothetical protein
MWVLEPYSDISDGSLLVVADVRAIEILRDAYDSQRKLKQTMNKYFYMQAKAAAALKRILIHHVPFHQYLYRLANKRAQGLIFF